MSDSKNVSVSTGPSIGFAGLLTILFIGLKLTGLPGLGSGFFAPLWISFGLTVALFLSIAFLAVLGMVFGSRR